MTVPFMFPVKLFTRVPKYGTIYWFGRWLFGLAQRAQRSGDVRFYFVFFFHFL